MFYANYQLFRKNKVARVKASFNQSYGKEMMEIKYWKLELNKLKLRSIYNTYLGIIKSCANVLKVIHEEALEYLV